VSAAKEADLFQVFTMYRLCMRMKYSSGTKMYAVCSDQIVYEVCLCTLCQTVASNFWIFGGHDVCQALRQREAEVLTETSVCAQLLLACSNL